MCERRFLHCPRAELKSLGDKCSERFSYPDFGLAWSVHIQTGSEVGRVTGLRFFSSSSVSLVIGYVDLGLTLDIACLYVHIVNSLSAHSFWKVFDFSLKITLRFFIYGVLSS